MRILLLTDGIYPYVIGGMQKHSFYLCKYLVKSGCDVTLVHCVSEGESLPSENDVKEKIISEKSYYQNLKVITIHFPKPERIPGHYLRRSKEYSKQIFKKVSQDLSSFDFIYAKGFTAWHFIEQKKRGITMPPIGIKFHGYEMFQPAPSLKVKLEQLLLRKGVKYNNRNADVVFSYGGKITEIIKSIGAKEIIEIPTGIESEWLLDNYLENKKKEGKTHYLFLGRYERRKGIEELNEVIKVLGNDFNGDFHFIGPIPLDKRIIQNNVIYHGKIMEAKKIQEIMDRCDVLLCPSHSEGMPNVIMEGMARGLAIIATDVGATSLIVDDNNGWLIEANNFKALERVISYSANCTSEEIDLKGRRSIDKIKKGFLWDNIVKKFLESIEKSL